MNKITMLLFTIIFGIMFVGCNSQTNNPKNDANSSNVEAEGKGSAEGKELNIALESQPSTLDPVMTTSTPTRDVAKHVFESLVALNSDYQAEPLLAKSVNKSEDGKTYIFELRDDVQFHDGSEMTAADVVASMERWLKQTSTARATLGEDATFEKKDEYTVELELSEPAIGALTEMASVSAPIMPEKIVESAGDKEVGDFIGTGPFKFDDWKTDQYIHLKKFDDYKSVDSDPDGLTGKKEALVEGLNFQIVTDPSTRESGIQTGEYDIARALNYDSYDQLEANPDLKLNLEEFGNLAFVYNTKSGLFKDKKARQAINAALSAEDIMKTAFGYEEFYSLSSGYVNEAIVDFYTDAGDEGYNQNDLEKGKKLLDETDYNGEEIVILTYRDDEYHYKSAVAAQEQLKDIGVNVDVKVVDQPTYVDLREDPENWDMLTVGFSIKSNPTQDLSLDPDWPGWPEDDKIEELKSKISLSTSTDDARDTWSELQSYVSTDYVPIILLGQYKKIAATRGNVDNYQEFQGPLLWNTNIDD